MGKPVVIPPGGGEVVGDSPDRRVEILSDHSGLHATWSRFGPGRDGADLHVHRHHTDLFYVLEGELTLRLGPEGESVAVPAGTLARVPPLVVHGFRNGTDAELRYLNLHAPGVGFADYLRATRDGRALSYDQHPPPADGGRAPGDAVIGGGEAGSDGRMLLADLPELSVTEAWSGAEPAHAHVSRVASLYVLEGELALTAGGQELRAPAGTWAQVPAGVTHAVSAWGGPARYLELHSPG